MCGSTRGATTTGLLATASAVQTMAIRWSPGNGLGSLASRTTGLVSTLWLSLSLVCQRKPHHPYLSPLLFSRETIKVAKHAACESTCKRMCTQRNVCSYAELDDAFLDLIDYSDDVWQVAERVRFSARMLRCGTVQKQSITFFLIKSYQDGSNF